MPDLPPPFAGWLEEHPEGGFILVHDGTHSPALCNYEAVVDYLDREEPTDLEVIRVRIVGGDPLKALENIASLYDVPGDLTAE